MVPAATAAGLPAITVYARDITARTRLHLQPGFATVIRADRRIETVAVGDPRLVNATVVHRGADVFDVVLQPQADTGTTNMVLWVGDVTTVWDLDIGPGRRTADVVFVVTQGSPAAAPPPVSPAPAPPATRPPRPQGPPAENRPAPATSGRSAGEAPASSIDLRQTVGTVTAVFRASRGATGITVRYEITNGGETDLLIKPASILVRADGRLVAYAMARDSVDRGRPDLIPRGATENGVMEVAIPRARQVELVLALTPAGPPATPAGSATGPPTPAAPSARAGTTPSAAMPVVLQATFSGLDRLAVAGAP